MSIFRTREGGQTKRKLGREGGREEGCEEKINLHSTLSLVGDSWSHRAGEKKHHSLRTEHHNLKKHIKLQKQCRQIFKIARPEKRRKDQLDSTKAR